MKDNPEALQAIQRPYPIWAIPKVKPKPGQKHLAPSVRPPPPLSPFVSAGRRGDGRPRDALGLAAPPAIGPGVPPATRESGGMNADDQLLGRLQRLQTTENQNAGPVNC